MSGRNAVPIAIIGGFLGSGKTSLLTHILSADHGLRVAVLINDFGEINIDAQLVVAIEGQRTISLANGCICCTIRDDLLTEVARLMAMDLPPEYIVIETSGISDPAAVAQTFLLDHQHRHVRVEAIISVLDADLASIPEDYQSLAHSQIEVADIVVLNKTDLVNAGQIAAMRQFVKQATPQARLLETTHGRIPSEIIFGAGQQHVLSGNHDRVPECRPARHVHSSLFATWTYRTRRPFSFDALHRAIECLPDEIYRVKGFVQLEIDPCERAVLQVTGRRGWLKLDGAWPDGSMHATELVFIGRPGVVSAESIADVFCRAIDESNRPAPEGRIVEDLRALSVVFT